MSYGYTHLARGSVPEADLGRDYEDVSFTTSDGLELEGWYIPSRNGAAVISFPGREATQKQARMLARHGYGVLLFDRRGEGESDGDPNSWGWGGYRDVEAAAQYLRRRPDRGRRSDWRHRPLGGRRDAPGGGREVGRAGRGGLRGSRDPVGPRRRRRRAGKEPARCRVDGPADRRRRSLRQRAGAPRSGRAGHSHLAHASVPHPCDPRSGGEELSRDYYHAAREPKSLWEIGQGGHVGGIDAVPEEYERRVVGFFDDALLASR